MTAGRIFPDSLVPKLYLGTQVPGNSIARSEQQSCADNPVPKWSLGTMKFSLTLAASTMKPSVLRYLNPFYFEIRFLSWAAWSNIAIGCLLLPISIYLSLCWNQIMQKAADFTPTEDEYLASSDIEKLRHFAKLAVKLNRDFMGNINDVLYGFALLALGIFLLFLWNAFLLRKAHSLLKPENGDRRS